MSDINGSYDVVVKSPMGEQKLALIVKTDGDKFAGTTTGAMGSADIAGEVAGNTIKWKQAVTSPMPLTLEFQATITGDALAGTMNTGAFGSFSMSGKRAS